MVQGAAAELFKVWAVTVRARGRELDARVVLCLHDELLVHVPAEHAARRGRMVDDALQEAAAPVGAPTARCGSWPTRRSSPAGPTPSG